MLRPVRSDRSCALARGDLSIVGVALWWTAAGALLLIAAVFDSVAILILAAVCCGVGQGVGLQGATQVIAVGADAEFRGRPSPSSLSGAISVPP